MKSGLKKFVVSILRWEAKRVLKRYKPKIVAVTGSVGKTGAKDAIFTILSQSEHARKSEKSFNSDIGVPLAIMGLPNAWSSFIGWVENIGEGFILPWRNEKYPTWLVLEVGVDRPGDIKRLSWLRPNIVVFTHFPNVPVHVEYFESPEAVFKEKRQLKHVLQPDGTLIVNADDPNLMHEEVEQEGQHKITYGFSEHATVRGFDYSVKYIEGLPTGISFSAQFQQNVVKVELAGLLGRHHAYPVLAGLAVIVAEGKSFEKAAAQVQEHLPAPGRMRLLQGEQGTTIIDDSYNSSPVAVQAGLDALTTLQIPGRKIVVLGDMLELGDFSVHEHRNVGQLVASVADVFITVGVRMLAAAEGAMSVKGRCTHVESFQTTDEALALLKKIISEGDVVFVKGSQGMRMERLVEGLLLDPQAGVNLLPRQDPHWKTIQ